MHNPVLFQKIVLLSGGHDADVQAKAALHEVQARMYWLLEKRLKQLSRTLIKWRWTTNVELPEAWETIDPPSESVFEHWHLETIHKLTSFLGYWKNPMEPFGYLGLMDKTEKLISD